ncbi:hypothetical protein [Kribbella sp. NPDC050459]|uniref:hypothetical protein n=1 Tax=Kribbella sp. NPDC050459 TaxID=3155785 RepID=UPI0033D0A4E1
MIEAEVPHRRWLEPAELLRIARRDVTVCGEESLEAVIMREPSLLIRLPSSSTPRLDLHTYRVRRDRWESGEGAHLTGMGVFMAVLESLTEPPALWQFEVSAPRTRFSSILM